MFFHENIIPQFCPQVILFLTAARIILFYFKATNLHLIFRQNLQQNHVFM